MKKIILFAFTAALLASCNHNQPLEPVQTQSIQDPEPTHQKRYFAVYDSVSVGNSEVIKVNDSTITSGAYTSVSDPAFNVIAIERVVTIEVNYGDTIKLNFYGAGPQTASLKIFETDSLYSVPSKVLQAKMFFNNELNPGFKWVLNY